MNSPFNSVLKKLTQNREKEVIQLLTALARLPEILIIYDSHENKYEDGFLSSNFSIQSESYKNPLRVSKLTSEDLILCLNPTDADLTELAKKTAAQIFVINGDINHKYDETLHDGQFSKKDFKSYLKKVEEIWPNIKGSLASHPDFDGNLRPALFLDRDGVVIEHVDYIQSPGDVRLNEGIAELINEAHNKNWIVVLITNQSGVGRGYFAWKDFDAVQLRMMQLLAKKNAWIDRVVVAGYHDSSQTYEGQMHPHFRKPRSSMIMSVAQELRIDRESSYMVGDRTLDIRTGYNAGVGNLYLLKSEIVEIEQSPLQTYNNRTIEFRIVSDLAKITLNK